MMVIRLSLIFLLPLFAIAGVTALLAAPRILKEDFVAAEAQAKDGLELMGKYIAILPKLLLVFLLVMLVVYAIGIGSVLAIYYVIFR